MTQKKKATAPKKGLDAIVHHSRVRHHSAPQNPPAQATKSFDRGFMMVAIVTIVAVLGIATIFLFASHATRVGNAIAPNSCIEAIVILSDGCRQGDQDSCDNVPILADICFGSNTAQKTGKAFETLEVPSDCYCEGVYKGSSSSKAECDALCS